MTCVATLIGTCKKNLLKLFFEKINLPACAVLLLQRQFFPFHSLKVKYFDFSLMYV